MTTGDALITAVDGGPRIELHNGLGGVATELFFLVQRLVDEGTATGTFDSATMSAVAPGAPLQDYLAAATTATLRGSIGIDGGWETSGEAAAALIDPDGAYSVSYFEI